MRKLMFTLAVLVSGFSALGVHASGDIYVGKDAKGNLFFTDTPPTYKGFDRFLSVPSRSGSVFKNFSVNFNKFNDLIEEQAFLTGVDPALIKAVIFAESAFNPKAVSSAGAQGLMQLMPHVADRLGVNDPFSPSENIRGGTQLLAKLLSQYDTDVKLSLAAYNAGPAAVKKYGGVPPYAETQAYVEKVQTLLTHFQGKGLETRP